MTTPDLSPPAVPGHVLRAVIGEGASSVVWSGVDERGGSVAVKVPREGLDTEASPDFERHVLTAVRHEHLVPLRDAVRLDDGRTALVFDLVTGASLRSVVRARGRFRPGEVVTVLTPICEAVAALHAAGAIHGDVSPGNIMLTEGGRPLVLDLGAARIMGHTGEVCGTPGFIAPEVREGVAPTSASDVFSLGAVAWFCLTGNGSPDTVQRLGLDTIRSHVGSDLAEVVAACIDPDPARRPEAGRLARLVYEATAAEPVEVVVGGDEASALTHRLRAEAALDRPAHHRTGHVRRRLAVVGIVAAMAVGAGAWFVLGRSPAALAGSSPTPADPVGTVARTGPSTPPQGAPGTVAPPLESDEERGWTTTGPGVEHDAAAPRQRAKELLQVLSERRAGVLVARDVAGLAGVHRSGTASHEADVRLIEELVDGGNRYADLELRVAEASWVRGDAEHATIRGRVDWSAYLVIDGAGGAHPQPSAQGEVLDFELVLGSSGWRIEGINAAQST